MNNQGNATRNRRQISTSTSPAGQTVEKQLRIPGRHAWNLLSGSLILVLLLGTRGFGEQPAEDSSSRAGQPIQAFCIDFNWGPGGPNGFAEPGHWANADPKKHIAWYKQLGVNVVQSFCVSCNGYSWYKHGVVPAQPGLKFDFLPELVRLGHQNQMKVMGYYCVGANTLWGQTHPELSYGIPSASHIPLTTEYVNYLCASIRDALAKTGIDGFMLDWFFHGPYRPRDAKLKWLPCEQQMWVELMKGPFPGKDVVTTEQELEFKRRAVQRCWKQIRHAAKSTKRDCIIWLSCHDLQHPQLAHSKLLHEVDWLMNEAGNIETLESIRKQTGPDTRLITCVVGWGDRHNARVLVPAARARGIGIYGFSRPNENSLPLPVDTYLSKPISDFQGNDRNIATLARAYNNQPFQWIKK